MNNRNALTTAIFICLLTSVFVNAQTSDKTNCTQFPIIPVIAEYKQSALFFRQWINGDPRYAEINAFVGEGEKPSIQVVLVEKDWRETFYSNDEMQVKELTSEGKQAYFVPIDFKKIAGDVDAQPTYGFGFEDKHKQKVLWRFIPASRPSERGRGLTPLVNAPGLRLFYRYLGTLAGAGTSVRMGDKEFEAEPWTEVSAPPYFVAYRGSITEGLDAGSLSVGEENWRVAACPKELKEGELWEFIAEKNGRKRSFRIASRRGDELQLEETKELKDTLNSARLALVMRQTKNGLALRSIERKSKTDGLRITFAPEVNFAAPTGTVFQVDLGKQKDTANGTILIEKQGDSLQLRWQFESPGWAKNKRLTTLIQSSLLNYNIKTF